MQKYKILVAEDEQIARENLEHILLKEGYEVTSFEKGYDALRQMQEQDFDLVITDLKMPDIDGIQLLESVRGQYPEIEVLVITGFATVSSAVEAMQKGAYFYLPKPFNINELRILVQRALEKRSFEISNQ